MEELVEVIGATDEQGIEVYAKDNGGDVAYPGRICYDENTRQLVADTLV